MLSVLEVVYVIGEDHEIKMGGCRGGGGISIAKSEYLKVLFL